MYLKKVYVDGKVDHVRFLRPAPERQNIPPRSYGMGLAEGWLSASQGKLTITTPDDVDNVVYAIEKPPGHYCAHCGKSVANSKEGVAHVAADHAEQTALAGVPSGVRKINHFECVKVEG